MHSEQVLLFQFFFGFGLLVFTGACLYRRTRVDAFREQIFSLRDELFDYMWRHNLSYDLPAYRLTRLQLNGMIRLADRIHLFTFVVVVYQMYKQYFSGKKKKEIEIIQAIEDIEDGNRRRYFKAVHKQIASRLVHFVFLEGLGAFLFRPLQMAHKSLSILEFCYDFLYEATEDWAERLIKLGGDQEMARRVLGNNHARWV